MASYWLEMKNQFNTFNLTWDKYKNDANAIWYFYDE